MTNFHFTISSFEPSNPHEINHTPWIVEQKNARTPTTTPTTLNEQPLNKGRIVVKGATSNRLSQAIHRKYGAIWAVCLDWDEQGTLTVFDDPEYVKNTEKQMTV